MKLKQQTKFKLIFFGCCIVFVYLLMKQYQIMQVSMTIEKEQTLILIDAGHGGIDPGKVGVNGALEKDINLSIALKLKALFEKENIFVKMTREEDTGLYQESDSNKKKIDMQNRRELMIEEEPDIILSIHQNSFQQESSSGAQVFYYKDSEKSQELAQVIQNKLREELNPQNNREIKANDSYYLLKINTCPMVIVECGFLSNWEEANLLVDDLYQGKIAQAICNAVLEFIAN